MIYYQTDRKALGKEPTLHVKRTCVRLLKAGGSKPVELTEDQARRRKRCRFCFPEDGGESEGTTDA